MHVFFALNVKPEDHDNLMAILNSMQVDTNDESMLSSEDSKKSDRKEYMQNYYQKTKKSTRKKVDLTVETVENVDNNVESVENTDIQQNSTDFQQNSTVDNVETHLSIINQSNSKININDLNNNSQENNTLHERININAQNVEKVLKKQNSTQKSVEKDELTPDDDSYWNVFGKKKELAIAFYREAKIPPKKTEFGRWQKDLDQFIEAGITVDVMVQAIRQLYQSGLTIKAPGSVFNTARSIMLRPKVAQSQQPKPTYNAFELLAMRENGIPVPEYDVEISA